MLEIATKLYNLNTLILAVLISLVAHAVVLFAVSHNIKHRITASPHSGSEPALITARIVQRISQDSEYNNKYWQSVSTLPNAVVGKELNKKSRFNNNVQVGIPTVSVVSHIDTPPAKINGSAPIFVESTEQRKDSTSSTKYFSSEEVDSPARPIGEISLKSYSKFTEEKQTGKAIIRIWLSDNGIVDAVEIISSSPLDFGKIAAKMIEATRFSPAIRDGVTVATEIQFEIVIIE